MGIFEAIVLGLVQGLTEFLPISSSAHLVFGQQLLGVNEAGLVFEVLVHFATLAAVLIFFRQDVLSLIKKPWQRLSWLIILGALPTGVIGLVFEPFFEKLYASALVAAVMLLVTGGFLWVAESVPAGTTKIDQMPVFQPLLIGLAQGLAIIPGISRSGSTITAGLLLGLEREAAARYAFLLSIPVILGATALNVKDLVEAPEVYAAFWRPYLAGMVAATLSGYFAIKVLLNLVNKGKLRYFSFYCWAIGLTIIIIHLT